LSEARSGDEKDRKDAATKKEGKDGGGKEAQAVKDTGNGKAVKFGKAWGAEWLWGLKGSET
jgi:hypothetical protein